MADTNQRWFKFHVAGNPANYCQVLYGTPARAASYCAGMHGHQNLTQWEYAEMSDDEIALGKLRGREQEFSR